MARASRSRVPRASHWRPPMARRYVQPIARRPITGASPGHSPGSSSVLRGIHILATLPIVGGFFLTAQSRRKVAGFAVCGEMPDGRSFGGVERVERVAVGVDHAIGEEQPPIDRVPCFVVPDLLAVRADGVDVVIA